jgi:hypothetical protein
MFYSCISCSQRLWNARNQIIGLQALLSVRHDACLHCCSSALRYDEYCHTKE